ncbi:MAG: class I SAM-dependent DNA methyltransferase [Euzebya sp.]
MGNPWLDSSEVPRGQAYQERLRARAERGEYLHGEADLVEGLGPRSVLDAGCGTGRVAIELAQRDIQVVGVDLDPEMLAVARELSTQVEWIGADVSTLSLGRTFDLVLAAGNLMIFLTPGTGPAAVTCFAGHVRPGGHLVAGFTVAGGPSGIDLPVADYDAWCEAAGLELVQRYATWEGEPYAAGPYAVSIHRRP